MVKFSNLKQREFLLIISISLVIFSSVLSAADIAEDLHLNIQVTDSNGVATTGTYAFAFNISNSTDCAVANIVYSNLTTRETDVRGIVSVYLNNVTLNFNQQYWLCYYRNGTLTDTISLARAPYSFRTLNVNLTNVTANSNFTSSYNVTAHTFLGQLNASNVTNDIWISWAEAINGTLASWANVINGTMTSWSQAINGTLARTDAANTFGAFNQTFDTSTLFVSSNNDRVGIGTTTPINALNVVGDINVTGGGNFSGTYGFNGGWQANGISIVGGDLYAQTVFVYNLTSLTVNSLLVNGSIIPQFGWDNVFDIGNSSLRYRNLTLGGNASINGSAYIFNNITLGSSTADYIIANGLVASHFVPVDNARDLGTSANRWQVAYVDVLNANSIAAGEVNISGTNFDTFTIHTNNTGDDERNSSLAFERGTPVINAVIKWDSTNGSERFEFNFPVYLQPDKNLTLDNFFFADSLNNRLGVNTTTPQNTLNVVGNGNITDTLYVSGNNLTVGYLYATNASYATWANVVNGTMASWAEAINGTLASWANIVNGTMASWSQAINGTLARTDAANTFGAFNQTFDTSTLFVNANTDSVGIGTTTPVADNVLHINDTSGTGRVLFESLPGQNFVFRFREGTTDRGYISFDNPNNNWQFVNENASGNISFYTGTGAALTMALTRDNRVGINTSSPINTLNVIGTMNVTNTSAGKSNTGQFIVNGSGYVGIGVNPGSGLKLLQISGNGDTRVSAESTSTTDFVGFVADQEGTGSLFMGGYGSAASGGQFSQSLASGGFVYTNNGPMGIGTGDNFGLSIATNSVARITINNSGNVGIGTTNPGTILSIFQNGAPNVTIGRTDSITSANEIYGTIKFNGTNSAGGLFEAASIRAVHDDTDAGNRKGRLEFTTASTVDFAPTLRMLINSNGNVGIGTTNPSHKLNVVGEINVTSTLFVGGAADGAGTPLLMVGDTANGQMTNGITINKGTATNEILAFKGSDITHGVTLEAETDTYGFIRKEGGANGILGIWGFADTGTQALFLVGVSNTVDTAKSTAAKGIVQIKGSKASGTDAVDAGSNANLFVITTDDGTARFALDNEGDSWQDGGITAVGSLNVTNGSAGATMYFNESNGLLRFGQ
ncbi:hypothetical protein HYT24_00540, partial [Candidatus Pacearchaeota archaeon]|nr:hypothetical protein [Candidatus Pacearchaeota archaeon]